MGQGIPRLAHGIQHGLDRLWLQIEDDLDAVGSALVQEKVDVFTKGQVIEGFVGTLAPEVRRKDGVQPLRIWRIGIAGETKIVAQGLAKLLAQFSIGIGNLGNRPGQLPLIKLAKPIGEDSLNQLLQHGLDILNQHHVLRAAPEVLRGVIAGYDALQAVLVVDDQYGIVITQAVQQVEEVFIGAVLACLDKSISYVQCIDGNWPHRSGATPLGVASATCSASMATPKLERARTIESPVIKPRGRLSESTTGN